MSVTNASVGIPTRIHEGFHSSQVRPDHSKCQENSRSSSHQLHDADNEDQSVVAEIVDDDQLYPTKPKHVLDNTSEGLDTSRAEPSMFIDAFQDAKTDRYAQAKSLIVQSTPNEQPQPHGFTPDNIDSAEDINLRSKHNLNIPSHDKMDAVTMQSLQPKTVTAKNRKYHGTFFSDHKPLSHKSKRHSQHDRDDHNPKGKESNVIDFSDKK